MGVAAESAALPGRIAPASHRPAPWARAGTAERSHRAFGNTVKAQEAFLEADKYTTAARFLRLLSGKRMTDVEAALLLQRAWRLRRMQRLSDFSQRVLNYDAKGSKAAAQLASFDFARAHRR